MKDSKISYHKAKQMLWEASVYQKANKNRLTEIINDMFEKEYIKSEVKDKLLNYIKVIV